MLSALRFLYIAAVSVLALGGAYLGLTHPDSPVPREYNPTKRLYVGDPATFMTGWKLDAAVGDIDLCRAVLADAGAQYSPIADRIESDVCHIREGVELRGVGSLQMAPVQTRCDIALRLAMWERHGLQPAARDMLGTQVTGLAHFSSYSCRTMRTGGGGSTRMSTHATADAIDVAGFTMGDGRRLSLKQTWTRDGPEAAFLKAARDTACRWFVTTLGPDFNSLHADHFHLQARGWGTCR